MAPYKFRLATLLRLRQIRRDELRGRLADAFAAAAKIAEGEQQLKAQLEEIHLKIRSASGQRDMDVNTIMETQRYELVLKTQLKDLGGKAAMIEEEIEKRRQVVIEAERDVRSLELLDEQGRATWQKEATKQDAIQMDEVASILVQRQKMAR